MITDKEKESIINCAKKYGIKSVILFGSAILGNKYRDIDIAIKGIKPALFFKFYGELFMNLDKPIDVIDLDENHPINEIVLDEGLKIYG